MMDLHHNGYNLQDTVIVTDRGYQSICNIQRLLDIEINYVCGVPLTEESVKQLFERYKSSLSNPAFLNGRLKVAARTSKELWEKLLTPVLCTSVLRCICINTLNLLPNRPSLFIKNRGSPGEEKQRRKAAFGRPEQSQKLHC